MIKNVNENTKQDIYSIEQYDRNIDETLNERLKEAKEKMQADFDERVKMVEEEKDLLARFVKSVGFSKLMNKTLIATHKQGQAYYVFFNV